MAGVLVLLQGRTVRLGCLKVGQLICKRLSLTRVVGKGPSGPTRHRLVQQAFPKGFLPWVLGYLLLAVVGYRHCLMSCPATLPAGKPAFGVISLFNAWTIWWNADRLRSGLKDYWNAPIFWPEKGTFALSEPQPLTALVAPVVWWTNPVVGYHVYFVLSLVLNGIFARRLVWQMTGQSWVSGIAGALVVWLPLVFQQPELLQYAPLWPILWSWDITLHLFDKIKMQYILGLGVAITLTFFASMYSGLFLVLLLIVISPWFIGFRVPQKGLAFALALLWAAILLIPLALPIQKTLSQHARGHPSDRVDLLSAVPSDWLRTPEHAWESQLLPYSVSGRRLNPGWVRVCFASLALVSLFFMKRAPVQENRGVAFLGFTGMAAIVASLGPKFHLFGWQPWCFLAHVFFPLAMIRSPYRFAYLAQLAILILASVGLKRLCDGLILRLRDGSHKFLLRSAQVGLGGILLFEVPPAAPFFVAAPNYAEPPGWVLFLSLHSKSREPVLLLDFPRTGRALEFDGIVRAMLWQPVYRSPMINGYAAFLPAHWCALADAWQRAAYSKEALAALRELDVKYLVRPPTFPPPPANLPPGVFLKKLAEDETGYEIWEVTWSSVPKGVNNTRVADLQ